MNALRLLRSLAPAVLTLASVAAAQTTGTIVGVVTDASTGLPVAGAMLVATSPNLQGEQTAIADERGRYRITFLPPGPYRLAVSAPGYHPTERSDLNLRLDRTLRADLAATPEAIQVEELVVKTGVAPVINAGSAESGVVATREVLDDVPLVARSFDQAAILAPAAQADRYGTAFAGSESVENRYVVDGFDVSDPLQGVNLVSLLPDFVQEVSVSTGNFMPERGRALGGVVSAVTKSGSNELHGSVFSNFMPRLWIEPRGEAIGATGEAVWTRPTPRRGAYDLDLGFELGGPIKKDVLWFHAGFAPVLKRTVTERFLKVNMLDVAGRIQTDDSGNAVQQEIPDSAVPYDTVTRTWQYTGKLTWLPSEDHTLSLAAFGVPWSQDFAFPNMNAPEYLRRSSQSDFVGDVVARWSGRFLEKRLLVEAVAGWHLDHWRTSPPRQGPGFDLYDTPRIGWIGQYPLSLFEPVPEACLGNDVLCPVRGYRTGGWGVIEDLRQDRASARLSAAWVFDLVGPHLLKGGGEVERDSALDRRRWTGGAAYAYRDTGFLTGFTMFASGYLRPNPTSGLPAPAFYDWMEGRPVSWNPALFIQDGWQIHPTLTLNYGLRWEVQTLEDSLWSNASSRIRIYDNVAPRASLAWDPTARGRSKITAAWGRFYESIPLDLPALSFGSLQGISARYGPGLACDAYSGPSPRPFDPSKQCPLVRNGVFDLNGNLTTYSYWDGRVPVAPDLEGQYVDQFAVAGEYELWSDLSVGVEYQGRRLGRVIEDMSSNEGLDYFIANPSESKPWTVGGRTFDPRSARGTDLATRRRIDTPFPKPERSYDGLTFRGTKVFSRGWLLQASWTLSVLRGNYSGLYRPETGQLMPNITSDYDLPTLMANRRGPLPLDRTHLVRLFGAYRWQATPRLAATLGGTFNAMSGTPMNALGADLQYGRTEAFIIPRGMGGRTPFLTQVDLRGQLEYAFQGPLALRISADVFNVLDSKTPISLDQNYTYDAVRPMVGVDCGSRNAASQKNPLQALQGDCPDIVYLRTVDGRPAMVNKNWGKPTAYQAPISLRLGMAVVF